MKADGRPLLDRLRELAPPHEPVSIQRWIARRLALTAIAVLGLLLLLGCSSTPSGPASLSRAPEVLPVTAWRFSWVTAPEYGQNL